MRHTNARRGVFAAVGSGWRTSSTPDELRARAVRLYRWSDPKPVIRQLAAQLGVHHEALRNWVLCRRRHKIHYAEVRFMPMWWRVPAHSLV